MQAREEHFLRAHQKAFRKHIGHNLFPKIVLKKTLRQHLKKTVSESDLQQWFDPLAIAVCPKDAKCLRVTFPHRHFAAWFTGSILETFEKNLQEAVGESWKVQYLQYEAQHHGQHGDQPLSIPVREAVVSFPYGIEYTFSTFLPHATNSFALAAIKEAAHVHKAEYTPLILTGPSGSGKTHLLKSLGNAISALQGQASLFYGDITDIRHLHDTKDLVEARTALLRNSFVLLDEFQAVEDQPEVHELLIQLFDSFYDKRRQIVLASSQPISLLSLPEKLASRLHRGLSLQLVPPDLDIRLEYVSQYARQKGLKISKLQSLTLSQRFEDMRGLQGALLKLLAFSRLVKHDLSDTEFIQLLESSADSKSRAVDPQRIVTVVADHFQLDPRDMMSDKRERRIVRARQTAMYLCRELTHSSYPALGRLFGGKDHSTVMHGIKKIEQLQSDDLDMKKMLSTLKKQCLAQRQEES